MTPAPASRGRSTTGSAPGLIAGDAGDALLAGYERSLPQVYGYLVARVGSPEAAEDLTSETYLAAVDAIGRGTLTEPTTAWLVGVARHKLVDHWRRQNREERRLAAVADLSDDTEDPWDELVEVGRAREVLDSLGGHHRSALVLRYLDGLAVREVADALERTVDATEALLVRARRAFRVSYQDQADLDERHGTPQKRSRPSTPDHPTDGGDPS